MNIALNIGFILKRLIHFYTDYILNQGISVWGWETLKSLRNN